MVTFFGFGPRAKSMKRRDFIVGLLGGAAVGSPLAGQVLSDGKAPRIGFLTRKTDPSVSAQIDAFRRGLRDLGWLGVSERRGEP